MTSSIRRHIPIPPLYTWRGFCKEVRRLQLEDLPYQARPLMQRTKEVFEYEELLDSDQLMARNHFVQVFVSRQWGPDPTESQLRILMQSLDAFFFSGLLTGDRKYIGDRDHRVKLEFREDIFKQIGKLGNVDTVVLGRSTAERRTRWDNSDRRVTIRVDATFAVPAEGRIVRHSLIRALEILIHEMAHAYFQVFACYCGVCRREIGATGHGPVWQELKQAMYMTIRGWNFSLDKLFLNDQDDFLDEM